MTVYLSLKEDYNMKIMPLRGKTLLTKKSPMVFQPWLGFISACDIAWSWCLQADLGHL